MPSAENLSRRWRSSRRISAWLLAVWLAMTLGGTYFARELSAVVLGWPFSFWVAAQGALIVYLALVCLYAWLMHRLDVTHGTAEDD